MFGSKKNQNVIKKEKKDNFIFGTLIMGIGVAAILFIVLLNVQKNVMSNYEKGSAVVAKQSVPEGVIITEKNAGDYFVLSEYEKDKISKAAYTDMESLYGKITVSLIDEKSIVTDAMVDELSDEMLVEKGLVKASINVSGINQAVNGTLRTGDRVDLYNLIKNEKPAYTGAEEQGYEEEDTFTYRTREVWQNVLVYEVFTSDGTRILSDDTESLASYFTVLINRNDAADFYTDFDSSTVQIVKLPAVAKSESKEPTEEENKLKEEDSVSDKIPE